MERFTRHGSTMNFWADFLFELKNAEYAVIDRLAAYEDTELEPEEIEQFKGEALGLRIDKQEFEEYRSLCNIDHLHELIEAEQEGRLHITPKSVWHIGDSGLHEVPYKPWMAKWIESGTKFWLTKEEAEAALKGDNK